VTGGVKFFLVFTLIGACFTTYPVWKYVLMTLGVFCTVGGFEWMWKEEDDK
jgi:uncharacterized membrane protein